MERLTEKIEEHYIERQERFNGKIVGKQMCLDKLGKYEDLEDQGLLLRIPEEAYFIKDNMVHKGWVQELVYSPCRRLLLDIRYDDNSLDSYRGYVGDTVFLMQEAAEQKLTEMENE